LSSGRSPDSLQKAKPFPPERRMRPGAGPRPAGPAAIRTSQPEGPAQRADFFEVNDIARAIDWFADGVELHRARAAGRCVASGVAFNDEAVHVSAGLSGQSHGKGHRGDNAQELRAFQNGRLAVEKGARVEVERNSSPGSAPMTSIFSWAGSPCARRSSAPGMARGMPAPMST